MGLQKRREEGRSRFTGKEEEYLNMEGESHPIEKKRDS